MEQLDAILEKRKRLVNNRGICALGAGLLAYNTYMSFKMGAPLIYPAIILLLTAITVLLAVCAHRSIGKIDKEISRLAKVEEKANRQP